MVLCGRPVFVPGRKDTVTNPIVIIEVLSPSTREYDRVKKFALSKPLDSLREYMLVDSERIHATRLAQRDDGQWTIEMYDGPNAVLPFESLGVEMPLARFYDKVEFESAA
jgi:Uma2 family endonuclease